MSVTPDLSTSAIFSPDGIYRYSLTRQLRQPRLDEDTSYLPKVTVMFICLNPSTADEINNDPTVRRLLRFATEWDYLYLVLCNIFALRSTDPRLLYSHDDPVGPANDSWITGWAGQVDKIVAAWGTHGAYLERGAKVRDLLRGFPLYSFGVTREGHPRHPLYLRADTELTRI